MTVNRLQDFDRAARAVEVLLRKFPNVYGLLGDQRIPLGEHIPAWAAMEKRYQVYRDLGGQPVLVATLYGPTGAGKSTLFRRLTGINVPAGDVRRPTTYACAMAVPEDWFNGPQRLKKLFPGFLLECLQDTAQLGLPPNSQNETKIFYKSYNDKGFPLILVDVPDFDSIARQNWKKAEALLQRAEIVFFITTGEKYADDVVVKALHCACRLAARLVYILTKTKSAEHARLKWEDLLQKLAQTPPYADEFQEKRSNGLTLLEFLRGCSVYFSPWSDSPKLEDVQAVSRGAPRLEDLLRGLPAANLLLESFLEPVIPVVEICQQELKKADDLCRKRRDDLERAGNDCDKAAEHLASSVFPVGRIMDIWYKEVSQQRSWWAKLISWPAQFISARVRELRSILNPLRSASPPPDVGSQEELEAKNLRKIVDDLLDKWRGDFRHEAPQMLCDKRLDQLMEQFFKIPLPKSAEDWEDLVRQKARQWAKENPWLVNILPMIADFLTLAGGAFLAVDIFMSGGQIGLAALTLAAGGGARIFLKFFENAKMKKEIDEIHGHYVEQRSREWKQHLEKYLFRPVFQPWLDWIKQMEQAPIKDCEQACDDLEKLVQQIRETSVGKLHTT
jgi:energy-coupling factor transporter ATP-binding protein EcfA2